MRIPTLLPVIVRLAFDMGRKFRSPPKENIGEWKIIEFITRSGNWGKFRTSEGISLPFPRTLSEAKVFVKNLEEERLKRSISLQRFKEILDKKIITKRIQKAKIQKMVKSSTLKKRINSRD